MLALALVGITCRDRDLMGPGLPSQAALAIVPQMERAAATGGPSFVSLRTVRGILTPADGGPSYSAEASFVNDTATLAFDVTFPGPTQRYTLTLAAIDTVGDTLFRSMREVTASPGTNAPVRDTLHYVAPDTAVSIIALALADTIVFGADTLQISATGFDAKRQPVNPLYIGWSSRDTLVAKVISSGPSTGKIIGADVDALVWIVARAFNGVADSLSVRVAAKAASVVIANDTLRTVVGAAVSTSAVVLDRAGAQLDRPVVWSSLDTTVAVVQPLLGSSPATSGAVAPQLIAVTGVRAGTTRIVAASGATADTSVVVVAPAPVAVVQIVPDSLAILVGDSVRFGVVLLDARGDTLTGRAVSWTSADQALATIAATTGTVRGIAPGTVAIAATSEGIVDTAWVRIAAQPLAIARTSVSPKAVRFLALGESAQIVAQSYAPDSSLAPGRYSWSVHGGVGILSVDSLGRVVALGLGKAWVVATEQGGTADSADVSVEQLVQTVQLTPNIVRGTVGDTVRFSATAVDARGNPIAYGSASWRNLENFVTTLDSGGVALLAEPGLDTVSVTIGGLTARAEISVQSAASQVTIGGPTALVAIGDTTVLHASALDRYQKAIPAPGFEWTVRNPSVAAVVGAAGDSAIVVSLANGDAGILAQLGTAVGAVQLSVVQKPAALTVTPGAATVGIGGRTMLGAQLVDARGVALAQWPEQVAWSLSTAADSALVQVDGAGEVIGKGGQGTATVVASVAGLTATARVDVSDAAVKTVSFGRDTIAVGLDTVKVPVILSAPAGGQGLVVTLGVLGTEASWVGTSSVTFGPTETLQYAQLTGREAGAVTLTVEDSTRLFAADSALGVVRSGARFADWWLNPVDTLHVNATDDVPLRVVLRNAAPVGGVPIVVRAEGPQGIATISPAPVNVPAGQLSADVVLRSAAPGTLLVTPETRGFAGASSVVVVDTAVLRLYADTSRGGCDGPCQSPSRTTAATGGTFARAPYNAPQRSTASAAVLGQQRNASTRSITQPYPYPTAGDPAHIVLGAGQYLPTAQSRGSCYYSCGAVLALPRYTFAGVRARLVVDDPSIARAEDDAAVPAQYDATYMSVSGLAAGTTNIRAQATDWREGSVKVTVTTPRLVAVWAGDPLPLPGHLAGDSIDVLVTDSLAVAHPRLSSLAVHASSSAPSIVSVRDSIVVIAAGEARTAAFLVPRAAGTAWIHLRAGGHVADSVQVTVEAPAIRTYSSDLLIGAGQMRAGDISIQLDEPATRTVVVNVRSLDPSIVALRDTQFVIVPGWTYPRAGASTPTIVGMKQGSTQVVVEADSGFAAETLSVVVTTPHVGASASGGTTGAPVSVYVYASDSAGGWAASSDPLGLDNVRVVSSDPAVLALDTIVAIPPGMQYTSFTVTPRAAGTTLLSASRAGYASDAGVPMTVSGPALWAGLASCTYYPYYYCPSDRVGVGQKSGAADLQVSVSAPTTRDVVVRFAGAKSVQLPDSVVIPSGQTEVRFGFSGLTPGVDSIQVLPDSGYGAGAISVGTTPSFIQPIVNGYTDWAPDTATTGSSMSFAVQVRDETGQAHPAARDVKLVITSSNPEVVSADSASLLIPVDGTQTAAIALQFMKPGTASITISDAAGVLAPVTLRPTVVTGPRLVFSAARASVGMRQSTVVTVSLPVAAQGALVTLKSSNPRLAQPVIAVDTLRDYPYTSASFTVEAYDTTGTVQLTALADGYERASIPLVVTRGRIQLDLPWDVSTLTPPAQASVSLTDEFGESHPTTVPVTVNVTSAHAEVAGPAVIQLQVPAGSSSMTSDVALSFTRTGTTVVTARDERSGPGSYIPAADTLTVRRARLYGYDGDVQLAPGQHRESNPSLEQMVATGLNVRFEMHPGSAVLPPADQVIPAGSWDFRYDVMAKSIGTDTVIVMADGYEPLRSIVRVGTGRISFDAYVAGSVMIPDSLAVGDSVAVALTALSPDGNSWPQADSAGFAITYASPSVVVTDGAGTTLSSLTVGAGSSSSAVVWLKATGAAGEVGDIVFARAGYGSFRARVRVVTGMQGVIALNGGR